MKKVYSASVTPVLDDGSLDKTGLANIIERNIAHKLDGIFLLGSMGEWGSFDDEFQYDLVRTACEINAGRLELLVGVNATSLPVSLKKMERYSKFDFKSYVFMPPGGRTSSLDPLKSIMTFLDAADRPSCYYYCPVNNNVSFSIRQLEKILEHPNLMALKDSSSNMFLRRELIRSKQVNGYKALLLNGQEWCCDEAMMLGYDGILCGMGALCSKLMVAIGRAVDADNFAEAKRLQEIFIDIFHGVYGPNVELPRLGQKYALVCLGVIATPLSPAHDLAELTADARKRIEKCVDEYKEFLV